MRDRQKSLLALAVKATAATEQGKLSWRAKGLGFLTQVGNMTLISRPSKSFTVGSRLAHYEVALLDNKGDTYEVVLGSEIILQNLFETAQSSAMNAPNLIDEAMAYLETL